MKEFTFYIDEKILMWIRSTVTIRAENKNEALSECINGNYYIEDVEYLYDTEENINPNENYDFPTIEIYNEKDDELLYDNVRGKLK